MKKLLLLLTVLLGFIPSYTQEYINPENVWIYGYFGLEERYYVETWGDDTVINGENTKTLTRKWFGVFRDFNSGDVSGIYGPYDGGYINVKLLNNQVYIYNSNRNAFEFVFDFDAEVGDTWDLITYFDYDCSGIEDFHIEFTNMVDEIYMIEGEINSIEILSTRTLDSTYPNSSWYNGSIYKNIGPTMYYTVCVEPLDILDTYPEYREICYTDYCFGTLAGLNYFADENGAYINNIDEDILIEMLSIHNQNKQQLEFTITTNPVKDILHFQTDYHVSNIIIYNAQGKQVFEQNGNALQCNVSSLPTGVYHVVIKTGEGVQGSQKFIKQ